MLFWLIQFCFKSNSFCFCFFGIGPLIVSWFMGNRMSVSRLWNLILFKQIKQKRESWPKRTISRVRTRPGRLQSFKRKSPFSENPLHNNLKKKQLVTQYQKWGGGKRWTLNIRSWKITIHLELGFISYFATIYNTLDSLTHTHNVQYMLVLSGLISFGMRVVPTFKP